MYYPDFAFIACFVVCVLGGIVWIYAQLKEFQTSLLNLRQEATMNEIKTDQIVHDLKEIEREAKECTSNTRIIISKLYEK